MFHAFFVLPVVALCGLLVQPAQAEPVDSSAVKAEPADSYFLNDRAITRIPTKVGLGALTAVGTGFLSVIVILPFIEEEPPGSPFPEELGPLLFGLLAGYPLGVYLADPVESSFWMTCVGYGLVFGAVVQTGSGSVVRLGNYTAVRNTKPAKPVFVRQSSILSPVSVAVEWKPVNDPIISYQTRRSTNGTTWPAWSDWTEEYGQGNTYRYTETGLRKKKDYWLSVQAVNKTPFDPGEGVKTEAIGEDNRPPCSPTAFKAKAGNGQVSLSWSTPTGTNCAALTHYEYRYKASGGRVSARRRVRRCRA